MHLLILPETPTACLISLVVISGIQLLNHQKNRKGIPGAPEWHFSRQAHIFFLQQFFNITRSLEYRNMAVKLLLTKFDSPKNQNQPTEFSRISWANFLSRFFVIYVCDNKNGHYLMKRKFRQNVMLKKIIFDWLSILKY